MQVGLENGGPGTPVRGLPVFTVSVKIGAHFAAGTQAAGHFINLFNQIDGHERFCHPAGTTVPGTSGNFNRGRFQTVSGDRFAVSFGGAKGAAAGAGGIDLQGEIAFVAITGIDIQKTGETTVPVDFRGIAGTADDGGAIIAPHGQLQTDIGDQTELGKGIRPGRTSAAKVSDINAGGIVAG